MKRARSFLVPAIVALAWLRFTSAAVAQDQPEAPARDWSPAALADAAQYVLDEDQDYDLAIDMLREAIAKNPGDAGANYDPLAFRMQRTDKPEHGLAQLKAMLNDRRLMGAFVDESDDLWKWTAWKYGKRIGRSAVVWDPTPPKPEAEHQSPADGRDGEIRVRDISPADAGDLKSAAFEKLWMRAVFELHNIDGANDFNAITTQAMMGYLSEEEYIKSMFAVEFRAVQRTRKWYVEVYLPHAKKHKLSTSINEWYGSMWGSPKSQLARYTDKQSYPWVPYSAYYARLRSYGEKAMAQYSGLFAAPAAVADPALPTLGKGTRVKLAAGKKTTFEVPGVGQLEVEGPASVELAGEQRLQVPKGRVKLRRSGKSDRDFVIETPNGKVANLGTETTVSVEDGSQVDIVIRDGKVELITAQREPAEKEKSGADEWKKRKSLEYLRSLQ